MAEKVWKFCTVHWKEIGITSIGIHLLFHEIPLLLLALFSLF